MRAGEVLKDLRRSRDMCRWRSPAPRGHDHPI